jgi:hypothetical protein
VLKLTYEHRERQKNFPGALPPDPQEGDKREGREGGEGRGGRGGKVGEEQNLCPPPNNFGKFTPMA